MLDDLYLQAPSFPRKIYIILLCVGAGQSQQPRTPEEGTPRREQLSSWHLLQVSCPPRPEPETVQHFVQIRVTQKHQAICPLW